MTKPFLSIYVATPVAFLNEMPSFGSGNRRSHSLGKLHGQAPQAAPLAAYGEKDGKDF